MADTAASLMLVVAAALVDREGRVLVQQRPAGATLGGLWEFPGGKLDPGETPEMALARELREELAIDIDPATSTPLSFVSEPRGARSLLLLLYLVRGWSGEPTPLAATGLRWLSPADLHDLAMPHGDRRLVAALEQALAP